MKRCIDCRYCTGDRAIPECLHPDVVVDDPVYGIVAPVCALARLSTSRGALSNLTEPCGPEAVFFEPKPPHDPETVAIEPPMTVLRWVFGRWWFR